jgi:hypothetical protein
MNACDIPRLRDAVGQGYSLFDIRYFSLHEISPKNILLPNTPTSQASLPR